MKIANVDIKDIQKIQLEILLEFDRICKKHNIKYQLFAGTLLGCVRHEGFIPWDDDIDVCLLREDYEKFIELCQVELGSDYFLQNYDTDKNYIMQFSKIRKNDTVFLESVTSKCNIHHGIYIDIFPLDNIKPNTFRGNIQQKLLYFIGRINLTRIKILCVNTNNIFGRLLRLFFHYILKLIPDNTTNYIQSRLFCMFRDKDDIKYVSHLTNGASLSRFNKYAMEKEKFYDVIEGKFEGHYFPIPREYDKVLTNLFGAYMELPPIEHRQPHHGVIEVKI